MAEEFYSKRTIFTDKSTISPLLFGDVFQCNVLEDTVRNRDKNKDGKLQSSEKVYGQTAIPAGRYEIKMEWSSHFQRNMPFLHNERVGRTGGEKKGQTPFLFHDVMIHWANKPEQIIGCLAVGHYDPTIPDFVSSSQKAYNDLEPKILQALAKGPLFINITGGYS